MKHSWLKIGYNKAKCKNCPWCRQTEKFDGDNFMTVYLHPNGSKQYHAPDCGTPPPKQNDEVYSIKDVVGEQLNFEHLLRIENNENVLTGRVLKSRNLFMYRKH